LPHLEFLPVKKPAFLVAAAAALLVFGTAVPAPAQGPDVIVGAITGPSSYGSVGSIAAFSLGTDSCNIGTAPLQWVSNTNQHPVIAQNLYRVKDGRFEMIGISWLKHGFTALAQNLCNTCQNPGTGSLLGVGCSDPYGSGLNGSQSGLGPRWQVNAWTGVFAYPFNSPSYSGAIARRLQVAHADLDPTQNAGAQYIAEAQYVTPDDAAAGNHYNNASYRLASVTPNGSSYNLSLNGPTQRMQPAIQAWQNLDPSVQLNTVDVPGDGRLYVGFKLSAFINGLRRYEFAVYNLNCDRSVAGFEVALAPGATASSLYFRDVPYHSGELQNGVDWTPTVTGTSVRWDCTETFAQNPNANAIRWGTAYSFSFESAGDPGLVTLHLFKPGSPASVSTGPFTVPALAWMYNQPHATHRVDGLENNPFVGPVQKNVVGGATVTYTLQSAIPAQPWDVALSFIPGVASGFTTGSGQIINVNLGDPALTFLNGGFMASPLGPLPLTIPIVTPAANLTISTQLAVVDPAHPDGASLSALCQVDVAPCWGATVPITLSDDSNFELVLNSGTFCDLSGVSFGGTAYTRFFVNSNGSVSFNTGDNDYTPTANEFVNINRPRVAGYWTDLNPATGGTISAASNGSGLISVTFAGVPTYGNGSLVASFVISFNTATGSAAITGYVPPIGSTQSSLVGFHPGGSVAQSAVTWSTLVGAGLQTGTANRAIFQFVSGGVVSGFSSITLPNGLTSQFFVN
jgi:hypothetical protein